MPEIDDQTKIRLFTVGSIAPAIIGFTVWITMIYFKAEAAQEMNAKQEIRLDAQMHILIEIKEKLTRLEEKAGIQRGR